MPDSAPSFAETASALPLADLERGVQGWLLDGEISQHSPRTLEARRQLLDKLVWFLKQTGAARCGPLELRQFLAYVARGHLDAGGRWGNPRKTEPVRPRTVHTYHGHLKTFFRWLVSEEVLETSPMEKIATPIAPADQVQPFTAEQVKRLLAAARRSRSPRRDEALLLFLFDTGLRASEACGLCLKDVDVTGRRCTVIGKGNKHRTVPFGGTAAKAL